MYRPFTRFLFLFMLWEKSHCTLREDVIASSARVPPEHQKDDRQVVLDLPQGKLIGLLRRTPETLEAYGSFEGIPYALPPVDDLRFKDPRPPTKWKGTLDATKPRSQCMQRSGDAIVGSENCLFLNVYSPLNHLKNEPHHVMVYIHGGSFLEGSGSMLSNPELFIKEKVILVTLNYRLGPLGFLSLDTEDVPGNAGLKDQAFALRWVHSNIKCFGGNPKSVTIFGESAGGASVLLHQLSAMSRGLFHRVISISGSSLCDWAIQDEPTEVYEELAEILKLDHDNALENLHKIPAATICKAGERVKGLVSGDFGNYPFRPIVEMTFENKEAFLEMTPSTYYERGAFSQVPTMLGYTSKEFANTYNISLLPVFTEDPLFFLPRKWVVEASNESLRTAVQIIKEFYFDSEHLDITNRENLLSALDLSGDLGYLKPVTDAVELIAAKSKEPVFLYRFSHRGRLNDPAIEQFGIQGAAHYDELAYIFPRERPRVNVTSSDGWVRARLIKLYTNFAKFGTPNAKQNSQLLPINWLHVAPKNLNYMDINSELVSSKNPDHRRVRFWKNLERFVLKGPKKDRISI